MTNGLRFHGGIQAVLILVVAAAMATSALSQDDAPPPSADAFPPMDAFAPSADAPAFPAMAQPPAPPAGAANEPAPSAASTNATASGESATNQMPRDPFWPIGYIPIAKRKSITVQQASSTNVVVNEEPQWDAAMKKLELKGIMKKGSGFVAVINDEVVRPKDSISVTFNGRKYFWIIGDITAKGVKFQRDKVQ